MRFIQPFYIQYSILISDRKDRSGADSGVLPVARPHHVAIPVYGAADDGWHHHDIK